MVFKWREAHTPLFLEHFRKYQCLWNYKIDSYKNRDSRASAVKALIQDLGIQGVTEEDVKLKIKTIRTKYASELAKVKKSKSGGAAEDVYIPKLYWFQQADEFLNAVCHHRESSTNIITREKTPPHLQNEISLNAIGDTGQNQGVDVVVCKLEVDDDCHDGQSEDASQGANADQSEAIGATTHTWTPPNTHRAPKSRKRPIGPPIYKAIKRLKSISDENRASENEFDLFCRSLAVQLKKMPLARALMCQEKLQSVMVQERLASIIVPEPSQRSTINSSDETESHTYHSASW